MIFKRENNFNEIFKKHLSIGAIFIFLNLATISDDYVDVGTLVGSIYAFLMGLVFVINR